MFYEGYCGFRILPKEVPGPIAILLKWFLESTDFLLFTDPYNLYLSPFYFKKHKKCMGSSQKNIMFSYPTYLEIQEFVKFGKAITEKIVQWNAGNLQYEINIDQKHWNGHFGDMDRICWKIQGNFESSKPRNSKTQKPIILETKKQKTRGTKITTIFYL